MLDLLAARSAAVRAGLVLWLVASGGARERPRDLGEESVVGTW